MFIAFLITTGEKEMAYPSLVNVEFFRILVPGMYEGALVCVISLTGKSEVTEIPMRT